MVNAQVWLDREYPLETRSSITELNIIWKNLTGSLKLVGFDNLTKLICYNNQLTNLDVSGCLVLTKIDCSGNKLKDLTVFNKLLNCEALYLDNNHFMGSLSPLQQLNKLKKLWIEKTNLTTGLEYLPESLAEFRCSETKLAQELETYGNPNKDNYFNLLREWRKDNQFFIAKTQLIADRDRQIAFLTVELESKKEELTTATTSYQSEVKQLKEEKEELEIKLETLQTKYEELLEQADNRQKILKDLGEKRGKFETLKKAVNCRLDDYQILLINHLLEYQEDFAKYNTSSDEKKINEITDLFKSKSVQNIDNLCFLQTEITELDKQLDQARNQAEIIIEDLMKLTKGQFMIKGRQQNLILFGDVNYNNVQVGKVNVENSQVGGSLSIGVGQITERVDFNTSQTTIEEITEEFQTQIQIPPKTN